MKIEKDFIEACDSFLSGRMSEDERVSFFELLEHDPEKKEEFRRIEEIYEAIRDKETLELRRKLKRFQKKYGREPGRFIALFRRHRYAWLAAAAVVIALLSVFLVNIIAGYSPGQVIGNLFNPDGKKFILTSECRDLLIIDARGDLFKLIEPPDSINIKSGDALRFKWQTSLEGPVDLRIFNRKGREVLQLVEYNDCQSQHITMYQEGIYLYRFTLNGEALATGVFLVRKE